MIKTQIEYTTSDGTTFYDEVKANCHEDNWKKEMLAMNEQRRKSYPRKAWIASDGRCFNDIGLAIEWQDHINFDSKS